MPQVAIPLLPTDSDAPLRIAQNYKPALDNFKRPTINAQPLLDGLDKYLRANLHQTVDPQPFVEAAGAKSKAIGGALQTVGSLVTTYGKGGFNGVFSGSKTGSPAGTKTPATPTAGTTRYLDTGLKTPSTASTTAPSTTAPTTTATPPAPTPPTPTPSVSTTTTPTGINAEPQGTDPQMQRSLPAPSPTTEKGFGSYTAQDYSSGPGTLAYEVDKLDSATTAGANTSSRSSDPAPVPDPAKSPMPVQVNAVTVPQQPTLLLTIPGPIKELSKHSGADARRLATQEASTVAFDRAAPGYQALDPFSKSYVKDVLLRDANQGTPVQDEQQQIQIFNSWLKPSPAVVAGQQSQAGFTVPTGTTVDAQDQGSFILTRSGWHRIVSTSPQGATLTVPLDPQNAADRALLASLPAPATSGRSQRLGFGGQPISSQPYAWSTPGSFSMPPPTAARQWLPGSLQAPLFSAEQLLQSPQQSAPVTSQPAPVKAPLTPATTRVEEVSVTPADWLSGRVVLDDHGQLIFNPRRQSPSTPAPLAPFDVQTSAGPLHYDGRQWQRVLTSPQGERQLVTLRPEDPQDAALIHQQDTALLRELVMPDWLRWKKSRFKAEPTDATALSPFLPQPTTTPFGSPAFAPTGWQSLLDPHGTVLGGGILQPRQEDAWMAPQEPPTTVRVTHSNVEPDEPLYQAVMRDLLPSAENPGERNAGPLQKDEIRLIVHSSRFAEMDPKFRRETTNRMLVRLYQTIPVEQRTADTQAAWNMFATEAQTATDPTAMESVGNFFASTPEFLGNVVTSLAGQATAATLTANPVGAAVLAKPMAHALAGNTAKLAGLPASWFGERAGKFEEFLQDIASGKAPAPGTPGRGAWLEHWAQSFPELRQQSNQDLLDYYHVTHDPDTLHALGSQFKRGDWSRWGDEQLQSARNDPAMKLLPEFVREGVINNADLLNLVPAGGNLLKGAKLLRAGSRTARVVNALTHPIADVTIGVVGQMRDDPNASLGDLATGAASQHLTGKVIHAGSSGLRTLLPDGSTKPTGLSVGSAELPPVHILSSAELDANRINASWENNGLSEGQNRPSIEPPSGLGKPQGQNNPDFLPARYVLGISEGDDGSFTLHYPDGTSEHLPASLLESASTVELPPPSQTQTGTLGASMTGITYLPHGHLLYHYADGSTLSITSQTGQATHTLTGTGTLDQSPATVTSGATVGPRQSSPLPDGKTATTTQSTASQTQTRTQGQPQPALVTAGGGEDSTTPEGQPARQGTATRVTQGSPDPAPATSAGNGGSNRPPPPPRKPGLGGEGGSESDGSSPSGKNSGSTGDSNTGPVEGQPNNVEQPTLPGKDPAQTANNPSQATQSSAQPAPGKGFDPQTGKPIKSVSQDAEGNLILTLDDGTEKGTPLPPRPAHDLPEGTVLPPGTTLPRGVAVPKGVHVSPLHSFQAPVPAEHVWVDKSNGKVVAGEKLDPQGQHRVTYADGSTATLPKGTFQAEQQHVSQLRSHTELPSYYQMPDPPPVKQTKSYTDLETFRAETTKPGSLQPNTRYEYNDHHWITDEHSQTSRAGGKLSVGKHGRVGGNLQTKIGNEGVHARTDIGFHLIGDQFDGVVNRLNVLQGDVVLNGKAYKNFEMELRDIVDPPPGKGPARPVDVQIHVLRDAPGNARPSHFIFEYQVAGGPKKTMLFSNAPGNTPKTPQRKK